MHPSSAIPPLLLDSSVEPAVGAWLAQRGVPASNTPGDCAQLVALAQQTGSVILTRKTDYPALLEALGPAAPCLIWIGPLPGHPLVIEQLAQLIGPDADLLIPGHCIMMVPGRNELLRVQ